MLSFNGVTTLGAKPPTLVFVPRRVFAGPTAVLTVPFVHRVCVFAHFDYLLSLCCSRVIGALRYHEPPVRYFGNMVQVLGFHEPVHVIPEVL